MVRFARTGGEANSIAIRIAGVREGKCRCLRYWLARLVSSANHNGEDELSKHLIRLSPRGLKLKTLFSLLIIMILRSFVQLKKRYWCHKNGSY